MNNIFKAATRLYNVKCLLSPMKIALRANNAQYRQIARSLWYLSNPRNENHNFGKKLETSSKLCSCGCGKHGAHTKAEKELVEFLTEEILTERKAQKMKTLPTELEGFKVQLNGAEVTLTKTVDDETIKITFNVNHSVDTDAEPELNPQADKPNLGELKSKPDFKVDMTRGKTTIALQCSFLHPEDQEEGGYNNDIFGIDVISIYDGEWNEKAYAVLGEVIDSYLYDLLMNYLEDKGISNEFVDKLSEYSTAYEHSAYIGLLEGLSKFASGK